jgi:hypothetical protein
LTGLYISRYLTPGGWIEVADLCFPIQVEDDTLPPDSALKKWSDLALEATIKARRPINSAKDYKKQMEEAGFTNIVETKYKWPQNRWPKDPKYKELGTNIRMEHFCISTFSFLDVWRFYF